MKRLISNQSTICNDAASIPSGRFGDVDPLQLVEALDIVEMAARTGSADSPTSVRDVDLVWERGEGKQPCTSSRLSAGQNSHTQIFGTLDRILSYIPEHETEGVEKIDGTSTPFDLAGLPQQNLPMLQGPVRWRSTQDSSTILPSGDAKIPCLGLVGHGHASIPATIAKKSLERHLGFILPATISEKSATLNKTEKDSPELVAQKLTLEKKYNEAIALCKMSAGPKDWKQATSVYTSLVLLNILTGNEDASLAYSKRSLKLNRQSGDQAESALSLVLLGLVYLRFGHDRKALNTWREALQIVILVYGYDHTYVAVLLNNLGCIHYLQGAFVTGLQLFSESIDTSRKILRTPLKGIDAILLNISLSKGNIAMILARNGRVEAAGSLLEEVLSLQDSMTAGNAHWIVEETKQVMERVNECKENTATTSSATSSRFFGSKSELSEIVAIQTVNTFQHIHIDESQSSIFGNSDGVPMRSTCSKSPIDAIDASDNLDFIILGSLVKEYTSRQRVRAAVLSWFSKTIENDNKLHRLPFVPFQSTPRKRLRIPVDIDTSEAVNAELHLQEITEQAVDHLEHDEIEDALELFQSSLYSHKEKYGRAHHLVGTAIHNIGMVYLYAQEYSLALHSFQEAVTIRRAALGSEHPAVAASLMKIGMIFLLRRNPDGAREAFHRTMRVIRKSMGHGSIQMARTLNNLGVAHYEAGSYEEAKQTLCEARDILLQLLALQTPEGGTLRMQTRAIELALTSTLSNLGFLHCRQSSYKESFLMLKEANELRRKHGIILAPDIYCLEENLEYIGGVVRDIKQKEDAESEYDGSLMDKLFNSVLGQMKFAK